MQMNDFPPVIVENGVPFVIMNSAKIPMEQYMHVLNRHQKRAFLADLKKRSKKAVLRRADTTVSVPTEENTVAIENAGTPAIEDAEIVPTV